MGPSSPSLLLVSAGRPRVPGACSRQAPAGVAEATHAPLQRAVIPARRAPARPGAATVSECGPWAPASCMAIGALLQRQPLRPGMAGVAEPGLPRLCCSLSPLSSEAQRLAWEPLSGACRQHRSSRHLGLQAAGRRAGPCSACLHSQTSGKLTFPGDLLVTVPANAVCTCMHVPCCPWHPVCQAITCLQAPALSGGGGVVPLPGGAGSQVKPPGPRRQITSGARAWA